MSLSTAPALPSAAGASRHDILPHMNVVLIGFMGTGKSAVGRALAQVLSGRHIDTDYEITRRFGMPIPQVFATHGEDVFRAAETEVLESIAADVAKHDGPPLIVSTGGGTPLRPTNAALLRRIGRIVWLTAPVATILSRVEGKLERRPLLAGHADNPRARIEQLLTERDPQYQALADLRVDTSQSSSPRGTARRIADLLHSRENHEKTVPKR